MAESKVRDWVSDAEIHYDHDRYEEALDCFKKALEISPENKRALCGLGRIYGAKGNYSKSFEYIEKVLQDSPKYEDAWNAKADTYEHMGDYQSAIICYKKTLQINSANGYAREGIANMYKKMKNYQKAIECFEKILTDQQDKREAKGLSGLFIGDKNIWYSMGNIYEEMEKCEKAIECYEKALEIDPHDFNIWDETGMLYAKIGNQEKADYFHSRGKSKFFKDLFNHLNRGSAEPEPKTSLDWLKEGDKYYKEKN